MKGPLARGIARCVHSINLTERFPLGERSNESCSNESHLQLPGVGAVVKGSSTCECELRECDELVSAMELVSSSYICEFELGSRCNNPRNYKKLLDGFPGN